MRPQFLTLGVHLIWQRFFSFRPTFPSMPSLPQISTAPYHLPQLSPITPVPAGLHGFHNPRQLSPLFRHFPRSYTILHTLNVPTRLSTSLVTCPRLPRLSTTLHHCPQTRQLSMLSPALHTLHHFSPPQSAYNITNCPARLTIKRPVAILANAPRCLQFYFMGDKPVYRLISLCLISS